MMWKLTRYGLVFAAGQAFQILVESYQARLAVARFLNESMPPREKLEELRQRLRDLTDNAR